MPNLARSLLREMLCHGWSVSAGHGRHGWAWSWWIADGPGRPCQLREVRIDERGLQVADDGAELA
jgi:hypothetical protein